MTELERELIRLIREGDESVQGMIVAALRPEKGEAGRMAMIQKINRILQHHDERKLRLVYFFAKGLR